jgi:2-keto-4-pentenoate hydratase/2-oxohepta-3-ene-1,7-dioic acid hydratase in catechol pathway
MQFVSFNIGGGRSTFGIVNGGGIFDLGARMGSIVPTLRAYLEATALGVLAPVTPPSEADYRLDEVTYEPVIVAPRKIFGVGLNYDEHRIETGRAKSAHPALFTRFADTLVGHRQKLRRPAISATLDYEGELAVVIGRRADRVPRERALDCVAGYSCFNDASIRDWQYHTHQFIPGKNFPATGGFGPALVTPDEVDRFEARTIQTRLNGAVVQSATLGDMIFGVADLVAYISSFAPLLPGDVIATGTPGGVGFKRDPKLFMKAGDVVEVIVDGVGHLVNEVADEALRA